MKKCNSYAFPKVAVNGRMNEEKGWEARCTLGSRLGPLAGSHVPATWGMSF